jgi:hypothetical protein
MATIETRHTHRRDRIGLGPGCRTRPAGGTIAFMDYRVRFDQIPIRYEDEVHVYGKVKLPITMTTLPAGMAAQHTEP